MARTNCPQCGKPKAAVYARISDDQKGERLGVTDQIEDCWIRAEGEGWCTCTAELDTYSDNDIGASKRKVRPGYQLLRAALAEGRYSALVSRDDGRLTRDSAIEAGQLVELVEHQKVQVITLWTGHWDLTTASGRKRVRDSFSDAQYEAERLGERVARARLRDARKGLPSPGGQRAWGFKANRVDHEPAEAEAIRDVARRILAGESLRSASLRYDKNPKDVRRALLAPRVAGKRAYHSNEQTRSAKCTGRADCPGCAFYPAVWEPILDNDTWLGVSALLRSRDRDKVWGTAARVHLLTGLLYCGVCGSRCQIVKKETKPRYACLPRGCVVRAAAPLDNYIRRAVLAVADLSLVSSELDPALTQAVQALEERISQADQMFVEGTLPPGAYTKMRSELEDRLAAARAGLDAAQQAQDRGELTVWTEHEGIPVEIEVSEAEFWWEQADLRQRRVLIDRHIRRITVLRTLRAGNVFDPERIEIDWR